MGETLIDLFIAQLTVLDVERIDRRHEHVLWRLHLVLVFLAAHNHGVVLVDPTPQIFPHLFVWPGEIDVATPDPRTIFFVMLDQGQRLRVVHNHEIVLQKIADAVFVNDLFVNFLLDAGEIDLSALQRVVHFLGDREKIRRALNHAPLGPKTETVQQQSERRNRLGHTAAVVGRIEIRYPESLELARLLSNSLNLLLSDERLVIFDLGDAMTRHLLSDSFAEGDTLAADASGD